MRDRHQLLLITAGAVVGLLAVILAVKGNPANMGFCIACFLRDMAGGLGLHRAGAVQYLRPEIIGLVLGAFMAALLGKDFKSTGGSSPVLRFILGMLMISGALIFLGCPLRLILRLAGGDWNALVALPGYLAGIWAGTFFLKKGYSLGRSQAQPALNSYAAPVLSSLLLLLLLAAPAFIYFSTEGPGAARAPVTAALGAGLLAGVLAQRSRLCTMGVFRDLILFKDFHLFSGIAALFIVTLAGNLISGRFAPGFVGQPVAHTDGLWSFLGMAVVGLAAVLAGGCPLRQLILSAEGDGDALLTVCGMLFGAAMMHNFGLAASPAGVAPAGQWTVIIALVLLITIGAGNLASAGISNRKKAASADTAS